MLALISVMHTNDVSEAVKLEPEVFKKDPFARIIMDQVLVPNSIREKY